MPHLRARLLQGLRFLGWAMGLQFLSSSFTPLRGWTSHLAGSSGTKLPPGLQSVFRRRAELWAPKPLEAEVGKGLCQICHQIYFSLCKGEVQLLHGKHCEATMVLGDALGDRAGLAAISFS